MPAHSSPLDKAHAHEVRWPNVAPIFEASRGITGMCFVYLIGEPDDGPVKIGSSTDPIRRLRSMQTGNPRRLRLEHVLIGHADLERLLHEMWEPYAIRSAAKRQTPGTEWFTAAIREQLPAVIAHAAEQQLAYLKANSTGVIDSSHLTWLVRQSHAELGVATFVRDVPKLLGAHGGYARPRGSRA